MNNVGKYAIAIGDGEDRISRVRGWIKPEQMLKRKFALGCLLLQKG